MNYEVNILVNGSRCKQYNHDGKIFIEAKKNSEYSIEIKNNSFNRILAVCSVDGLDILTGKPAFEGNQGYVISGYNTGKFEGFRVSDEQVAKFVFDYKNQSYAASKGDNSEKNVGVIGIRLFQEKVKPLPPPPVVIEHHHHHFPKTYWYNGVYTTDNTTIWGDTLKCDNDVKLGATADCDMGDDDSLSFFSTTDNSKGMSTAQYSCNSVPIKGVKCSANAEKLSKVTIKNASFDMGTKFGEAKESKVVNVEFERGILALTTNIYYASRQSLIDMGVPLGNEKMISYPEPFKDSKYAVPPKGWQA